MDLGKKGTPEIPEKFDKIFRFLLQMKRNEQNHILAIEAFELHFHKQEELLKEFVEFLLVFLKNADSDVQGKIARRHLYIFSYLCEKFGFYDYKLELDDLAFSIDSPKQYSKLKQELESYQKKSKKVIQEIQQILQNLLGEAGFSCQIEGRYKNLFSIHRKCEKKLCKNISKLGDIFAFRIIFEGESEIAYDIVSLLHLRYTVLPHRYKDYIQIPKINGYQSIHTALCGVHKDLDLDIEVQVRNKFMDDVCRNGHAAHFLYSSEKKSQLINEREKNLIQLLQTEKDEDFMYVLTYLGDIKKIPIHTNVLKFAEKIHSDFSKTVRGAKVNNLLTHTYYVLENFDIVELLH